MTSFHTFDSKLGERHYIYEYQAFNTEVFCSELPVYCSRNVI